MTQLIIIKNEPSGMWVAWRINNEDEFDAFCERHDLKLSFDYPEFLTLNGDFTGEINRCLNQSCENTKYLALVA
jgi:hypothetical protein